MHATWRTGLSISLAIFSTGTAAEAQSRHVVGHAGRPEPATAMPSHPASIRPRGVGTTAAVMAYHRADPSSDRATTTGRAAISGAGTFRGVAASRVATGGEDDPLRPYSARVREAEQRAAMGSTRPRPLPTRATAPAPRHNYFPAIRPHCVPTRGGAMAGSLGRR